MRFWGSLVGAGRGGSQVSVTSQVNHACLFGRFRLAVCFAVCLLPPGGVFLNSPFEQSYHAACPQLIVLFPQVGKLVQFCAIPLQYIYGLDLTDSELPVETSSGYEYSQIGLQKYQYPCLPLAVKVSLVLHMWNAVNSFRHKPRRPLK